MSSITPTIDQDRLSKLSALRMLQALGYTYLAPEEANAPRGGRLSEVLLLGVLEKQLPKLYTIHRRGEEMPFSGEISAWALEEHSRNV